MTAKPPRPSLGYAHTVGSLGGVAEPLLASPLARDPFRGDYRLRALNNPSHALETLEPYARLHLDVIAARHLLACDLDGRSDPFAEVWLNDQLVGTSARRVFSVSPTWNYHIVLDVWSPKTIVRIRVMDHDSLTKNDVIGFVEFCVADLDPNSEASGWFELRRKRHLHGVAPVRVRRHRCRRDEDARRRGARSPSPEAAGRGPRHNASEPALPERRALSAEDLAPALRQAGPSRAGPSSPLRRPIERCRTVLALCRGQPPAEGAASAGRRSSSVERIMGKVAAVGAGAAEAAANAVRHQGRSIETFFDHAKAVVNGEESRPNAGEVHLRLWLDAATEDDGEWYAFCFPRPHFEVFPSRILSLEELYRDISEIKRMAVHSLQTFFCVPRYFAMWQNKFLSSLALAWWSCFCIWPKWVMPTLLLWAMLLLRLLRQRKWQERMLVHESTVPLNDFGYKAVSALGSTDRMARWIGRLVGSMGRSVMSEKSLRSFAGLSFRDGVPVMTFQALVQCLSEQPWAYHVAGPRKCPKGHPVAFLGSAGFGQNWSCENPGGCRSNSVDRPWRDAAQYHCGKCGVHICEPCIALNTRPPLWTTMPAELLPEFLETALVHLEEPLDHVREMLDLVLRLAAAPFQPTPAGTAAARSIFLGCAIAMVALYMLIWILSFPLDGVPRITTSATMIGLGWWALLSHLTITHRLTTKLRASSDYNKHRQRREEQSLSERWAFFTPDAPEGKGIHFSSV